MSAKQMALRAITGLPETATFRQIAEALRLAQQTEEALRRYDETGEMGEDLTDDEWRQFIAHTLKDELNDPREDIYTLEDGEPSHAPR